MSEQVKSELSAVLENVIQNSALLKKQVEEKRAEITAGEDQLAKFETLIATLQVSIADEKHLEAVIAQAGANALVSPTLPAGSADEAPAGTVQ
jgi:hypothetical protein